MKLTPYKLSIC